ncbi:MAG: hypothetical protein WCI39_00890 [Gallionellaceae bacterium]
MSNQNNDSEYAEDDCIPCDDPDRRLPNWRLVPCQECGINLVDAYVSNDTLREEGVASICELSIKRIAELDAEALREKTGAAEIPHTCAQCGSNA